MLSSFPYCCQQALFDAESTRIPFKKVSKSNDPWGREQHEISLNTYNDFSEKKDFGSIIHSPELFFAAYCKACVNVAELRYFEASLDQATFPLNDRLANNPATAQKITKNFEKHSSAIAVRITARNMNWSEAQHESETIRKIFEIFLKKQSSFTVILNKEEPSVVRSRISLLDDTENEIDSPEKYTIPAMEDILPALAIFCGLTVKNKQITYHPMYVWGKQKITTIRIDW